VADRQDVVLSLAQIAEDEYVIEIHNPTRRSIEVTVRRAEQFDLIQWDDRHLHLGPGESRIFNPRMSGEGPHGW
jgi:hypothetical protein